MIRMGSKVRVNVPKEKAHYQVEKYNGQEFVVKGRSQYNNGKCIYELYGAVSDMGVPYGFVEEWLNEVE